MKNKTIFKIQHKTENQMRKERSDFQEALNTKKPLQQHKDEEFSKINFSQTEPNPEYGQELQDYVTYGKVPVFNAVTIQTKY